MLTNEKIEFLCDEIANEIDEAYGKVNTATIIEKHIQEFSLENEIQDEAALTSQVLKKFEELYLCDPTQYAMNSRDDATYDGLCDEVLDEMHEVDIFEIDDILPMSGIDDEY